VNKDDDGAGILIMRVTYHVLLLPIVPFGLRCIRCNIQLCVCFVPLWYKHMYTFGSLGQPFIRTGFGKHSLAASDRHVLLDRFDRQKSNI
jgi:hypothetical protein